MRLLFSSSRRCFVSSRNVSVFRRAFCSLSTFRFISRKLCFSGEFLLVSIGRVLNIGLTLGEQAGRIYRRSVRSCFSSISIGTVGRSMSGVAVPMGRYQCGLVKVVIEPSTQQLVITGVGKSDEPEKVVGVGKLTSTLFFFSISSKFYFIGTTGGTDWRRFSNVHTSFWKKG